MKAIIIYDSLYGNTEKVARAIGKGFSSSARVVHVSNAKAADLTEVEVLFVGSPTQGGRPTAAIQTFLDTTPDSLFANVRMTAFDTRFAKNKHGFALKMLMQTIGFAAEKMVNTLEKKGAVLLAKPESFIVSGKEGPLKSGELERAEYWGETIEKEVFRLEKRR